MYKVLSSPTVWEFRAAWFRRTATDHRQENSSPAERSQRLLTDRAGMDEAQLYADDPEEGQAAQQQFQRGEDETGVGQGRSNM